MQLSIFSYVRLQNNHNIEMNCTTNGLSNSKPWLTSSLHDFFISELNQHFVHGFVRISPSEKETLYFPCLYLQGVMKEGDALFLNEFQCSLELIAIRDRHFRDDIITDTPFFQKELRPHVPERFYVLGDVLK
jgi:hypothetical protein